MRQGVGAGTLEGGAGLAGATVLAFSLPYSVLFREMIAMLLAGRVPVLGRDRSERDPVVIVGGAAVSINPEPVAPVADIAVIGEGEHSIPHIAVQLARWRRGEMARHRLLETVGCIPGVYAPALSDVRNVDRWQPSSLDEAKGVSSFITPLSHFKESLLIEAGRGCPGTCRFCVVGPLYRPVRWRRAAQIVEMATESSLRPRRVSLIGAAVSQHPEVVSAVTSLAGSGLEVGLSSLRVDHYQDDLARALSLASARTITMAPEAASERLRRLVGKPLPHETLVRAVATAAREGASKIRLYFLLGLPWETADDRREIVELCAELSSVTSGGSCLLVPSLNPFVPKPMTPFAACPPPNEEELREAIRELQTKLHALPRVQPRSGSPRLAVVDHRLSMGGRELAEGMVNMASRGASWSDWLRDTQGAVSGVPVYPWGPPEDALHQEWRRAAHQAQR
jgi:radical SAM superfamily enzyme YgiQ (UPF0313 family)